MYDKQNKKQKRRFFKINNSNYYSNILDELFSCYDKRNYSLVCDHAAQYFLT